MSEQNRTMHHLTPTKCKKHEFTEYTNKKNINSWWSCLFNVWNPNKKSKNV